MNHMNEPDQLPEGEPFKAFSDDYIRGFDHGKMVGNEEGRRQLIEELKRLLEL